MESDQDRAPADDDGIAPSRWRTLVMILAVVAAIAINVLQFPAVEGSLSRTWQALTRADEADLAAIATERDVSGASELQFSLVLALREHSPEVALLLSDEFTPGGVISPELLVGLGRVRCFEQRSLSDTQLVSAVPTDHPPTASGLVGATREPFVLLLDEPPGPTVLMLDARELRGYIAMVDSNLLPMKLRPEPPC